MRHGSIVKLGSLRPILLAESGPPFHLAEHRYKLRPVQQFVVHMFVEYVHTVRDVARAIAAT